MKERSRRSITVIALVMGILTAAVLVIAFLVTSEDDVSPTRPDGRRSSIAQGSTGQVSISGSVTLASDVLTERPVPIDSGRVLLVSPTAASPRDATPVAQLPIDAGRFAGTIPIGEWRPCVEQSGRRPQCSTITVTITTSAVLRLELGDGYLGASID